MPEHTLHRYPGVQPFSRQHQDCFFGRDTDREELLSLILLEKITVLFGKSGYGKSSLLQAGIAPALERESRRGKREYLPVFIRFHSRLGNEDYNWFDWFVFHLNEQAPDPGTVSHSLPRTIWGELKRRQTGSNQTFVLIFDQFEELFTYPPEQVEDFKNQLADLLYADIPEYVEVHEDQLSAEEAAWMSRKLDTRAVIAIRSDRLSELDQLKNTLPGILNKRFELRALNREQARQALEKPAGLEGEAFISAPFNWQTEALETTLESLSHDRQGRETGIEPFQLQVLAQYVESRVIEGAVVDRNGDGKPDVAVADLPDFDRLYEGFYEDALRKIQSSSQRRKARRLIEKGLIFEWDNQRINLHEKLIHHDYGVNAALIQQLIDLRLLRAEPSTSGGRNIELSHDAFVQPILNAARRRRQNRWRNVAIAALSLAAAFLFLVAGWFTLAAPPENQVIMEKNQELTVRFDSLNAVEAQEEKARSVVLNYVDCVNNHDVPCLSTLFRDTMERYHLQENLPRIKREEMERDYFQKRSEEKIEEVKDIAVNKIGTVFEVALNTTYRYEKKGRKPVIFQLKLDSTYTIFYIRSFIESD